MFETNGPGLIESIKDSWQIGGQNYFLHNLSCELRRGRDKTCYGYTNTFWDRFLFSLGMFIMDWRGRYFIRSIKWKKRFCSDKTVRMCEKQWTRHPVPWIASKAKKLYRKKG